ncbi:spike base protein, RCAP_Rcc01079 family [Celeribacter sp. SCSIO 80788]|jgi:hypothetical protein|uniref:spike base protein, RCAP_Rcc01079 family n=1 Tax=Celeribacter sp. SCSIO 80788 TaxID=3117013 RepID=UPI003DA37A09
MPAIDDFQGRAPARAGGPANLALVTPNDSTDLSHVSQWVYVGAAGALKVTTKGGQTLTTPTLIAGWHLIELTRIHATGTTASEIMVGW